METEAELVAGLKREILYNIAVTPIVLFVRIPLGLVYAAAIIVTGAIDRIDSWLPGWKRDFSSALRRFRKRPPLVQMHGPRERRP